MTEIIYPTDLKLTGPWLVEIDKLKNLDNMIDREWKKLSEYREEQIQKEITKKLKEYPAEKQDEYRKSVETNVRHDYILGREKRNIDIFFKSNKKMFVKSFKEAYEEPTIKEEIPTGFKMELELGDVSADLSIGEYFDKDGLSISVESQEPKISNELFYKFERWARSVAPPMWQKIWKKMGGIQWFFLYFTLFAVILIMPSSSSQYKKVLIAEANELISTGINKENIERATEIILKLETGFVPKDFRTNQSYWIKLYLIINSIVFILCLISSFPPKTYLGIGLGENKVKHWKLWIKIISIFIPIGILLPILLNQIKIW